MLFALGYIRQRKINKKLLFIIGFFALLFIITVSIFLYKFSYKMNTFSGLERLKALRLGWKYFVSHPILGIGWGVFPTWDIIRKYNKDYKLIFVGDATMSPYEILQPGGSVEYNNEEAGSEWMQRLTSAFPKFAWINPEPQGVWQYRQSIGLMQQLVSQRMYPLTIKGLEEAMRLLSK